MGALFKRDVVCTYHNLCASLFLDKTDLTSETNLRASKTGNKLSRAVSEGSLNQDLIGIALSGIESFTHIIKLYQIFISFFSRQNKYHVVKKIIYKIKKSPGYDLYAPGELSRMNMDERSEFMALKSLV